MPPELTDSAPTLGEEQVADQAREDRELIERALAQRDEHRRLQAEIARGVANQRRAQRRHSRRIWSLFVPSR
jgi:hypothetical protein